VKNLDKRINTLSQGNAILSALANIISSKEGLISYRNELQDNSSSQTALCPVCAAEQFGIIPEDDIAKQALSYQSEHLALLSTITQERNDINSKVNEVSNKQVNIAKQIYEEAIKKLEHERISLTGLRDKTQNFFDTISRLKNLDGNAYNTENMLSIDAIEGELKIVESALGNAESEEYAEAIRSKINRIAGIIKFN